MLERLMPLRRLYTNVNLQNQDLLTLVCGFLLGFGLVFNQLCCKLFF